jgi:hypothetical protein
MLLAASPVAARDFVVGTPPRGAAIVTRGAPAAVFTGSVPTRGLRPFVGGSRGLWRVSLRHFHDHHHRHFGARFRGPPPFLGDRQAPRRLALSQERAAVIATAANPVTVVFPSGERVVVSSATINRTGSPVIVSAPGSATILARSGDGLLETVGGMALVSHGMVFRSSPGNIVITNPDAALVEDGAGGVQVVSRASIE